MKFVGAECMPVGKKFTFNRKLFNFCHVVMAEFYSSKIEPNKL
jgi:hypothetical protein